MESIASTDRMTADELLLLPSGRARYELVKGELRVMEPAGWPHGKIAMNIGVPLGSFVLEKGLGRVFAAETGFILERDPDTVRAPDVAFIRRERLEHPPSTSGYWIGAPDLAVEVISPSDTYTAVQEKVIDWLEAGARMVLVADPRTSTVTVYCSLGDVVLLTEQETIDGGDVVPGWSLPVRDVFA